MSYDLYIACPHGNQATQLRLLVTERDPLPQYLQCIHGRRDRRTKELEPGEFNQLIANELSRLQSLGIKQAAMPDLQHLPTGTWFLQLTFTLAKPYISKDDDPFYVAESVNPVRKDKVFKVPMVSAASWKGLLRWTAMQVRLAEKKKALSDQEFAKERFRQTRLFGDEKGEEPGAAKDFAKYLNDMRPHAVSHYQQLVKQYFGLDANAKELPHHSGRLMCYPTFFNLIDVEVINPHSRKTKAGTHPIYLECVPDGAQGTFSLLYVPFDLIGQPNEAIIKQAKADLQIIAEAIGAMMLTYGFSAKRTSGYGTAEDAIMGVVKTGADERQFKDITFSKLVQEVANVAF